MDFEPTNFRRRAARATASCAHNGGRTRRLCFEQLEPRSMLNVGPGFANDSVDFSVAWAQNIGEPADLIGTQIDFRFSVRNVGFSSFSNVAVQDVTNPSNPAAVDAVLSHDGFNVGDLNKNHFLDPAENWQFTHAHTALADRQPVVGQVTAELTGIQAVNKTAETHYFGIDSRVEVTKLIDGARANNPNGPNKLVDDPIDFQYVVRNLGNVPLHVNLTDVVDGGSPLTPDFQGGDTDHDGLLDPGEVWTYQKQNQTVTLGPHVSHATATGLADTTDLAQQYNIFASTIIANGGDRGYFVGVESLPAARPLVTSADAPAQLELPSPPTSSAPLLPPVVPTLSPVELAGRLPIVLRLFDPAHAEGGGGQQISPVIVAAIPLSYYTPTRLDDGDSTGGSNLVGFQDVPDVLLVAFQTSLPSADVAELSDAKPDAPQLPELKKVWEDDLWLPSQVSAEVPLIVDQQPWYLKVIPGVVLCGSLVILFGPMVARRLPGNWSTYFNPRLLVRRLVNRRSPLK